MEYDPILDLMKRSIYRNPERPDVPFESVEIGKIISLSSFFSDAWHNAKGPCDSPDRLIEVRSSDR